MRRGTAQHRIWKETNEWFTHSIDSQFVVVGFRTIPLFSVFYSRVEANMMTITITLPDERLRELQATAFQLKVAPED